MVKKTISWFLGFFLPIYFFVFLGGGCILWCTSAAPQRPAHGTVPYQLATHLRTGWARSVLGRSRIQTRDYWFAVKCATIEPPLLSMLNFKLFEGIEKGSPLKMNVSWGYPIFSGNCSTGFQTPSGSPLKNIRYFENLYPLILSQSVDNTLTPFTCFFKGLLMAPETI